MLTTTLEHYREQRKITALGLVEARRRSRRGARAVAQVVTLYQSESIDLALGSAPEILAEQGIDAPPVAVVNRPSLLTGVPAVAGMVESASSAAALDRLVKTLIVDANRTAAGVDAGARTGVTGYARQINSPACPRCVVLAGRVYPNPNFPRHPGCDCMVIPTTRQLAGDLITNPYEAFEKGQIRGLSKADAEAIRDGADISQVVNVRRRAAGLVQGSSVMERTGRLTPAGIYRVASDKTEALGLLRRFGYLT